jgi:hypothetical protein
MPLTVVSRVDNCGIKFRGVHYGNYSEKIRFSQMFFVTNESSTMQHVITSITYRHVVI